MQDALLPEPCSRAELQPKPLKELIENASQLCELLLGPADFNPDALFFRIGFVMSPSVSFSFGPEGGEARFERLVIAHEVFDAAKAMFLKGYGIALSRRSQDPLVYLSNARFTPVVADHVFADVGIEIWELAEVRYAALRSYITLGGSLL